VATVLEKSQANYDAGLVDSYHEGKLDGKLDIAKKMFSDGESIETIIKWVDVPIDILKKEFQIL
jgi:hypothetical protein